ncbi:hypothetical protein L207DRAFT_519052 [Hyaloscypha variabilis F]|uniref:Ankyrin n=1 Tax=Hyaloscypha variabilis (strain UAMH 11265 / GT02V1 / F) TaxID=1149755 RepID=A0A2J6QZN4_HYAVF|nr:hypothetical protein L207DRAFT_519052 [Hyaloscypha variabilis F]
MDEIELYEQAQCIRIMLKAGADLSLNVDQGNFWITAFMQAVEYGSFLSLQIMLEFGDPFFNLNDICNTWSGKCSALTVLARDCGYDTSEIIDVVDKAILLLSRKANISCRDENGDSVLHTVLRSQRLHDSVLKQSTSYQGRAQAWELSLTAPRDLLAVFITAGADVYTTNNADETPSVVAREYGRVGEWIEALALCGYDFQEVLSSCVHRPTCVYQTAKLSFHEYCEQRLERKYPVLFDEGHNCEIYSNSECGDETESEESQSEDEDNEEFFDGNAYGRNGNEETRVAIDSLESIHGGGAMELPGGLESIDHGMDSGLDSRGNERMRRVEEIVEAQVPGLDDLFDNDLVGFDNFDFIDLLNNETVYDQVPQLDDLFNKEPEGMDVNLDIDDLLNDEMLEDSVGNEPDGMHFNLDFDDWLNDGDNFMQSFNDVN